jgi:hypothetical protein
MKRIHPRTAFRIVITLAAFAVLSYGAAVKGTHITPPISGWLWGGSTDDTLVGAGGNAATGLGWISTTSDNQPCGGANPDCYGLTFPLNNADGPVTGYAWSSNVGWIDFQPSAPYPSCAGCPASGVVRSGNALSGWARIVSILDAKNWLGSGTDNSGGWDGWVKMSGPSYGITIAPDTLSNGYSHRLEGYAWSDEFGWIYFGTDNTTNPPFPTVNFGSVTLSVVLTANPTSGNVPLNNVDLSADVGGSATGDITYEFDCTSDGIFDHAATNQIDPYLWQNGCDYPLAGTYTASVQATREGVQATDTETISVGGVASVDIKANGSDGPISVPPGSTANISWTSLNTSACQIRENGSPFANGRNGSQTTGALSLPTYTYTATCNPGGATDSVTVNVGAGAATCAPKNQAVRQGTPAKFTVTGNAPFSWSAPNGSPNTGVGASFSTTYAIEGSYTVTVSSGAVSDTCNVKVYRFGEVIPLF